MAGELPVLTASSGDPPGSPAPEAPAPTEMATAASAAVAVSDTFAVKNEPELDANKLHVYHVALELHGLSSTLVANLNRIVRDQLERASLSIVLNIAEAAGSHYLFVETVCGKRRSCAPQVAEATSIRSPRRRPLVT
jgi:hypothetical protein